jgi:DNA-binding CsgD family transcriptional regulator
MKTDVAAVTNAFMEMYPKEEVKTQKAIFRPEENDEIIFKQLKFAESVFPDKALTMCPISHPKISYYSPNCEYVLGHPHKDLMRMNISEFLSLAHPEDLPYIHQCYDYINRFGPYDPVEYRFSIYFRLRNADGNYGYICNENFAIRTEHDTYLYLMLFSNVTDKSKFHHVKLDVINRYKGKFRKIRTYNPRQGEQRITPRQNDIAQLIAKGYDNQEIANRLSVSIHTVKNHKQLLFKKVNVRNSVELANYVANELS